MMISPAMTPLRQRVLVTFVVGLALLIFVHVALRIVNFLQTESLADASLVVL